MKLKSIIFLKERLQSRLEKRKQQRVLKNQAKKLGSRSGTVKVIIGSGPTRSEGWLSTDLPVLDALKSSDWAHIFVRGMIDRILAEHVIEHWTSDQFRSFLRIVRRYLSSNGFIRIAVPDGFHPAQSYIDYVKPGGNGAGADDHKVLYNYFTITRILSGEQYEYKLLEYFDEIGQFHQIPWDINNGFIERSANYDSRNKKNPLSYTSLIIDARPGKTS